MMSRHFGFPSQEWRGKMDMQKELKLKELEAAAEKEVAKSSSGGKFAL